MLSIEKISVPAGTLLHKLASSGYTDCYTTTVTGRFALPQFIFAFYTTTLFKTERWILAWLVQKPSTDAEARQLAENATDKFAAWTVESRTDNELLTRDFLGRTGSWLMVAPEDDSQTRLYFGSAVRPKAGTTSFDFGFRVMLFGFHQVYSALLLASAKRKLTAR